MQKSKVNVFFMKTKIFRLFFIIISICEFFPLAAQPVNKADATAVENIRQVGKFDSWITRLIEESSIIGGNTALLYEPSFKDAMVEGRIAHVNAPGCLWRTSNAYADILGVVKTSTSVFPEKRGSGWCAKLEVNMANVKILGLINMDVTCQGTIYVGVLDEPVTDTKDPQRKIVYGIPFSSRPEALQFDYKAKVGNEFVRATGLSRVKKYEQKDYAEALMMLQYRWEDSEGNIYAKRVGTAYERIYKSTDRWIDGYRIPVLYGDITDSAKYEPYMGLIPMDVANYAVNSKGCKVPVREVGWADESAEPNWLIIRFSSSCGEAFYGGVGNVFWIDNVEIVF